ncbi:MAG TPA: hypothetical protein PK269_09605 [Bacteroidales bacterium]|nr:hypothetical protein [Bacteroidales bacterium]
MKIIKEINVRSNPEKIILNRSRYPGYSAGKTCQGSAVEVANEIG